MSSVMKEHVDATRDLVRAVDDLRVAVTREPPPDRGYVSDLVPPAWMAHAIRLCRDGADGIARYFKRVPDTYVLDPLCVRCVCGRTVAVPAQTFKECLGGCRWFIRDFSGVWAAALPRDDS